MSDTPRLENVFRDIVIIDLSAHPILRRMWSVTMTETRGPEGRFEVRDELAIETNGVVLNGRWLIMAESRKATPGTFRARGNLRLTHTHQNGTVLFHVDLGGGEFAVYDERAAKSVFGEEQVKTWRRRS